VPDPVDPQSLNRYSYVLNNPLRYTDPTGHCIPGYDCPNSQITGVEDPVYGGVDFLGQYSIEEFEGRNIYDSSGTIATLVHQVASEYAIPPELLAVILQLENNPEAGMWGVIGRFLKQQLTPLLQLLDRDHDGGLGYSRGVGNVKYGTAKAIIAYFAREYPESGLARGVSFSEAEFAESLDSIQGNLEYVAGYTRMAIDTLYHKGHTGPMSIEGLMLSANYYNTGDPRHEALEFGYGWGARALLVSASEGDLPLVFLCEESSR
jgi:hypothetical protein